MKIVIKVIYIIILFVLFSCEEEDKKITLDETFVLQYGETKILDDQAQFSITFTELLDDSRCPANVICFWGGQARVAVEVVENFNTLKTVLVNGSLMKDQAAEINTGHYKIELLKVIPYPEKAEDSVGKSEYSIQLVISSN